MGWLLHKQNTGRLNFWRVSIVAELTPWRVTNTDIAERLLRDWDLVMLKRKALLKTCHMISQLNEAWGNPDGFCTCNLRQDLLSSKSMLSNMKPKRHWNDLKTTMSLSWSNSVRVQTSVQLRIQGRTWKKAFRSRSDCNLTAVTKNAGKKILHFIIVK